MDRPKVPVNHSHNKGFFVALSRAWFVFEPKAYRNLLAALKDDGLTDKEIQAKEYFHFDYFRKRVPRLVPPPSQHYHRVRAVFALYGTQVTQIQWTDQSAFHVHFWCGYDVRILCRSDQRSRIEGCRMRINIREFAIIQTIYSGSPPKIIGRLYTGLIGIEKFTEMSGYEHLTNQIGYFIVA